MLRIALLQTVFRLSPGHSVASTPTTLLVYKGTETRPESVSVQPSTPLLLEQNLKIGFFDWEGMADAPDLSIRLANGIKQTMVTGWAFTARTNGCGDVNLNDTLSCLYRPLANDSGRLQVERISADSIRISTWILRGKWEMCCVTIPPYVVGYSFPHKPIFWSKSLPLSSAAKDTLVIGIDGSEVLILNVVAAQLAHRNQPRQQPTRALPALNDRLRKHGWILGKSP